MGKLSKDQIAALTRICPAGIETDVDLSRLSQWRVGGKADIIIRPHSTQQVAALCAWFSEEGLRPLVIGLTTNLLFSDEGVRVPIVQIGAGMSKLEIDGKTVTAQSGVWVPGFARQLMKAGLTGAEHICGIPGTLGGLVCMNGGSLRQGIGSNVVDVESVDAFGTIHQTSSDNCHFGYRESIFRNNGQIITSVRFELDNGDIATIRGKMLEILSSRRKKFPRKLPNCGSVFKSDPKMYEKVGPPGAVIERLGLKGMAVGGAQISPLHANFIVNNGAARSVDIIEIITRVGALAEAAYNYKMDVEVCYVTSDGFVIPADQASRR